ncbi:hypothetical protein [uncultured Psychroserpens sp.]|uniref:hypothetical protein n=1 Tax=uncultured Psychroserpens sp. TaxID=255436 RepID=UPI00263685BE|nr:hypothetical protein [uncultured Psychroserpens sp.]
MIFRLLIFCVFVSFYSHSQTIESSFKYTVEKDSIFLDEYDNAIDKRLFDFKLKSTLFYSLTMSNDTLVLNKLRFSHLFGELETPKKQQLFKFLSQRNNVDTTKVMIIHYQDTLKKINEFPEKSALIYSKDSSSHRHVISHKAFLKQHKKCQNKLNTKKTRVYHFYGHNNGHPESIKKLTWTKDHLHLINTLFRDAYKRYSAIIIHPDGSFYCWNYRDGNLDVYEDIRKGKRWDKHKKEFIKKLEALNSM